MNQEKASLLIVDDNETNLDLLSRYMCRNGYDTCTAEKGARAIEMILDEKQLFDIVLLDLMMPDISGREILKKLRRSYSLSELPIIMLTAKQENEAAIDALQLGANDYVIKPIDHNILKARVDTQVTLKRIQLAYHYIQQNLENLVKQRTVELDHVNQTLTHDRKRFKYLLSSSPAITYATSYDAKHKSNFVSDNVIEVLGYNPSEMVGDPEFWITHVHPKDKRHALRNISKNLGKGAGTVEYRFLHKDGKYRWVQDQHRVVFDENNNPVEIIGTWTNVSEQYELKEALSYTASHDMLTGLINRREFENRLKLIVGDLASETVQHVVCYLDLDQFKVINTTYGHAAGNELLKQVSELLQNILSRSDILAYLGGDEFGLLIQHCTINQANRILERILETFHEFRFTWKDKNLQITASIGVVPFNKYLGSPANVLSVAHSACFAAKEAGRNRIYIYSDTDEQVEQNHREMLWVERINKALEEDSFYLYFQPIVALDGNKHEHYELLIRMKDESGELIPPGAFLPAAERFNLSSKIDRWVIQTILSWLEAYTELLDDDSSWGINLSGLSLADETLLQFVVEEFDRKQIPPHKIYFEITETAAIANINNATQFIRTLKNHGCEFALDDFGSGLSSFSYLKNLPIDYIKIDGMFVKDMVNNTTDNAMVKAINDVSQAMNKKTIAEFVESYEIVNMLKTIGVNYAQGYGICKPQPLTEIINYKSLSKNIITH